MRSPPLLSSDQRTIYLNDHLAGSTFGLELARRTQSANRGTEFEAPLDELVEEIAADRRELEGIIERLGAPRDQMKVGAGWLAEKVGRLKPNGRLTGYSPLGRLLELEALSGGVNAKLGLWRAPRRAAAAEALFSLTASLARLPNSRPIPSHHEAMASAYSSPARSIRSLCPASGRRRSTFGSGGALKSSCHGSSGRSRRARRVLQKARPELRDA